MYRHRIETSDPCMQLRLSRSNTPQMAAVPENHDAYTHSHIHTIRPPSGSTSKMLMPATKLHVQTRTNTHRHAHQSSTQWLSPLKTLTAALPDLLPTIRTTSFPYSDPSLDCTCATSSTYRAGMRAYAPSMRALAAHVTGPHKALGTHVTLCSHAHQIMSALRCGLALMGHSSCSRARNPNRKLRHGPY
jgi:hypothetical protein